MKRLAWSVLLIAVTLGAAVPNCSHWVQQRFTHHSKVTHKHHTAATLRRWKIANEEDTLKQYQLACGDSVATLDVDVQDFVPKLDVPVFELPPNEEIATLDASVSQLLPDEDVPSNVSLTGFYIPPVWFGGGGSPPSNPVPTPEPATWVLLLTGILACKKGRA